MSKNKIIQATGEILKELAFLIKIHDYPDTIDFIKSILEFMEEEYDTETCDKIKAKFMRLKQDRKMLFEGR
jgi:hypothetical protein